MSLSGSRPPSDNTFNSKDEDETENDSPVVPRGESKRKINLDSGFDEAPYNVSPTPSPTTTTTTTAAAAVGNNNNLRHSHQHRHRPRRRGTETSSFQDRHDNPDHKNSDSGKSEGSISISSGISDQSDPPSGCSSRSSSNKTDDPFPLQTTVPQTPPPTSDGTVGPRETKPDYDFPSDTELSEIIAIMSGLATPRKQKQNANQFLIRESNSLPAERSRPSLIFAEPSSQTLTENLSRGDLIPLEKIRNSNSHGPPLYEKNNTHVANGGFAAIEDKISTVSEGRRYFQKGSKSVDRGTGTGSDGVSISESFRDLNRQKSQNSLNSLSSILIASRTGQIGPNKKKKNKGKKPRQPPPPKKEDVEVVEEFGTKRSWKQRLKFFLTLVASVVLIVSSSSLLFIVPIIIDPILVGLEAHFSPSPAQCRTVSKRNGSGPEECTIPSCREGCTADLLSCYFIEVEYHLGIDNASSVKSSPNAYLQYNNTSDSSRSQAQLLNSTQQDSRHDPFPNSNKISSVGNEQGKSAESDSHPHFVSQGPVQDGILLVNPGGCGFPPEINCTIFEKTYGEIGRTFPCYYSTQNESIVVPFYSRSEEISRLTVFLMVPCGTALLCSVLLYILLRWNPKPKRNKRKTKENQKDPSELNLSSNIQGSKSRATPTDDGDGMRLNMLNMSQPVTIGNETLSNIVGDLTGITSKNIMKKRHYAKFSTSFSSPNSENNSRKTSVSSLCVDSLEKDNLKLKLLNHHHNHSTDSDPSPLIPKPLNSSNLHSESNGLLLLRTTSLGNYNNLNEYSEKHYEKRPSHLLSGGGYTQLVPSSQLQLNKSSNHSTSAENHLDSTNKNQRKGLITVEQSSLNGNHFAWTPHNSNNSLS